MAPIPSSSNLLLHYTSPQTFVPSHTDIMFACESVIFAGLRRWSSARLHTAPAETLSYEAGQQLSKGLTCTAGGLVPAVCWQLGWGCTLDRVGQRGGSLSPFLSAGCLGFLTTGRLGSEDKYPKKTRHKDMAFLWPSLGSHSISSTVLSWLKVKVLAAQSCLTLPSHGL